MAEFLNTLSQYGQNTGLTPLERLPDSALKQGTIMDATAVKSASMLTPQDYELIAAGMGNQLGAETMGVVEKDLRTLDHLKLMDKYGPDLANKMRDQLTTARNKQRARSTNYRTDGGAAWDTVSGFGAAPVNVVAGISAFGLGQINDDLGAAITGGNAAFNEAVQSTQSATLAGDRNVSAAQNALSKRDSEAQWQQDIQGADTDFEKLMVGFEQIGRDAGSTVENLSAVGAQQLIAEAAGSLAVGGPIAKAVGKVGGAATSRISNASKVGPSKFASQANRAVDTARWPTAVALMEGGGTYSSTSQAVMSLPIETLRANPGFNEEVAAMLQENPEMNQVEAEQAVRVSLADELATSSGVRQMPLAAAAGTLTRYAETPFKVGSAKAALSNAAAETGEEAFQGGTSQVLTNQALLSVDPTQTLQEGVGEQVALGAIGGLGSAGLMQAPGAAVKTTGAVVGGVLSGTRKGLTALSDVVEDRAAKRDAQNFESQNEEATQIVANAPATTELANTSIDSTEATPEAKDKAKSVVQTTFDALKIDPQQLGVESLNEDLTQAVTSAKNVTEAIGNVASIMSQMGAARENVPEEQQADVDSYQTEAAILLTKLIGQLDSALSQDKTSLDILPTGSPVLEQYNNTVGFLETVRQHPTIKRELDKAQALLNKTLDGVTDEQLNSPKAQQIVDAAVASATISPAEGNLETINKILNNKRLNHRDDEGGPYIFSEGQQQVLRVSQALLQARKDLAAMNAQAGSNTRLDVVDGEIFNRDKYLNERAPKMSAQEFGMNILSLVKNKDFAGATAKLKEFSQFVEHMNNKVGAYNKHYADFGSKGVMNAEPIHYKALLPRFTGEGGVEFANTSTIRGHRGIYVAPNNATSVGLAQTVADETQILANVFNNFVETFPELGIGKVDAVPLTAELQGKVADVVAKHKKINPSSTGSSSEGSSEIKNPTAITDWAQKNFKGEPSRNSFVNKSDELRNVGRNSDADFVLEEFDRLTTEAAAKVTPVNPRGTAVATYEPTKKVNAKSLTNFGSKLLKLVGLTDYKLTVVLASTITKDWTMPGITEDVLATVLDVAENMNSGARKATMSVAHGANQIVIVVSDTQAKERPEAGLFEMLAHEIGHVVETDLFDGAPEEVRQAVLDAYAKYVETVSGKDAATLIRLKFPGILGDSYIGRLGEKVHMKEISDYLFGITRAGESYHLSFTEWHADQVARWVMTSKEPKGILETNKYFSKIAEKIKEIYALLLDSEKDPTEAMKQYMDGFVEAAKERIKLQAKPVTQTTKDNGYFAKARQVVVTTNSGPVERSGYDLYFGDAFWDSIGIVMTKVGNTWEVNVPYIFQGRIGMPSKTRAEAIEKAKAILQNLGKKKFFDTLVANSKKEGVPLSEALLKAGGEVAVGETATPTPVPVTPTATSTSTTPVLDSLPERIPGKPTMLYAGVGSRKTPPAIQKAMAELAKRLEALGYTLRTGDAMGADQAFRNASGKKEVFTAKDVKGDPKALALVDELHPNISALKKIGQFAVDLMARNAYQIFGRKLDTPVDFVLVWTPDGVTTHKGRNQNTGGTGQAISLASLKGIPVINMAKDGWEAELEKVLNKPKTSSTPTPKKEVPVTPLDTMDKETEFQNQLTEVVKPVGFLEKVGKPIVDRIFRMFNARLDKQGNNISRLFAGDSTTSSVQFVLDAIATPESVAKLLGRKPKFSTSPEILADYQHLLNKFVPQFAKLANGRLNYFLNHKKIETSEDIIKWSAFSQGKTLNIVEDVDGTFQYNQDMLEAAVMAALQWVIESSGRQTPMDDETVKKLTGKEVDEVSYEQMNKLKEGFSEEQIKFGIASKIAQYWGLKGKSDTRLGYADAIPEALAGELVQVLMQGKFVKSLKETAVIFYDDEGSEISRVNRYVPTEVLGKLIEYPSLIEEMVLTEPEELVFLGGDLPPVAKTKINSGGVNNSDTQMSAMEAQQNNPFFENVSGVSALLSMGIDGALSLFAHGELNDETKGNRNNLESMKGKNASISNAYTEMKNMLAKTKSRAEAMGTTSDKVEVRYAINVTKNGRYQMLGRYTPQASKLMRIAFMTTWSTLNLSENRAHARNFNIAIAQAFGQKVHRESFAKIEEGAAASLGKLDAVAKEALLSWLNDQSTKFPTEIIKQAFTEAGIEITPAAFNAYVEYMRTKMPGADMKAFKTSLSLEADGITNGPLNALMLLNIGKITPEFVMNLRRGGIFLGQDLTTYDSFGGQDIYLNSAEAMQESIKDLSTALDKFPKAQTQQRALLDVMRILLPEYVVSKYNEKNELQLEFSRKLIKNPLTVILYGSSPNGIAGKIAGELLDAFYEKASKAAQDGVNPAEAFFPNYENPQRNYELLIKLINDLTTQNLNHWVDKNGDTKYGVSSNERKVPNRLAKPIDFSTITFTTAEYESIRANILVGMVEPMVEGIHKSLGSDIFTAMEQIKNATQFQSSVYAAMFNARVKEAIKSRQKDEDGNPASSWMSPKELEAIAKELRPFFPMLRTEDHTIVMMKEKPLSSDDISYSRTFDEKMRTAPKVFFPASVGVGGIPYTVIAYADAAMIQRAANAGVLENTLPVHDGVEMPLDKVGEISSGLNKAVYDSTMQNPMKDIQKMFDKFLDSEGEIHNFLVEQVSKADMFFRSNGQKKTKEAYPEIYSILATAGLFPFSDRENDASDMSATELADAVISEMKNTNYQLQESAEVIDLRHQAISEVAASYDHMASAHIGYHNGKPTLGTTDADAIAEHLQNRVDELKAKKSADFKAQQEKNAAIGKLHSTTGVHILRGNNFLTLAKALNASKRQMQLLKHLTAILKNKDVSVITGDKDQINAYRESIGQPKYSDEDLNGLHGQTQFTETGAVIYLLNPSSETVLHELIHAATFQVISDYFNPDKEVSENAIDAIQNLQKLMSKFMSMPMGKDTLANQTIGRIRNVIKGYEAKGEHAEALNEFMAWSLANEGVFNDLKGRKTEEGFFKTLAKNIIKAVENILGIKFDNTFASQLVFNSAVLFKQITTPDVNVALNHQSAATDPRLTQIRSMLDMNVISKLRERMAKVQAGDRTIDLNVDAEEANKSVELADRIAQTFNLNEEQRVTMITLMMATSSLGSLDPSVMTRIQELYDHALKNLSEADLADAATTDPMLREQQGIPRYALLTDLNSSKDAKDRSRLLPTFLALSVVDNNFRNALYNIAVPTNPKVPGKTLDAMLENIGNGAMDSLNKYLSMENQPGNVQVAMDQLLENIQALSYREQTRVDKASIKLNNFLTDMEDTLVVKKDELADKVNAVANTQLTSTNPVRKAAGIGLSVVSSLASSKVADEKARAIIANLNQFAAQGGLAKAIADSGIQKFITDMVGRTGDNFPIYDWIKPARTMVQQVRQQSRDDLPIIFAKKFSRELTQQEWAMMYKVIGRTDLAALLNNKNVTDVLNLIVSKTARDDKISELEEVLYTHPNSTNMSQVLVEAKQLAHFMNTGIPGNDLKTNAQTIAHLTALVRNEAFTTALDQLITLYALRELPQEHKDIVADLINTEGDGVKFITDYLYQTRLDEMNKVNVSSRYNYRKGHLPSDQKVDGDVIVAPITKENELALLGYKRIGDYNSPTNDPDSERKAYFHSPVAQKAPVSQGIIQNVRHTVFGVDSYHGYSTTKMAGRVTNPKLVARLKKQIFQNDNKVESFIPIRNEDGDIIAFDRNFDPEMLLPLQQSEHFGKMVAVWRGRQIEEAISKDVNTGVIGGMKQMWFKDKGTSRAKEYINLKDPRRLTPVQRDMVKLFTPLFIEQLDDVFGDEGWYVRMDLVDDVIGYRNASVGDFFTGNSNWSPETQKVVRNMMVLLGDERAYRLLMGGEKRLQALMVDARQTIVVKSVVIPMYNIMSNTLHLVSRGVPLHMIAKGSLRKVAEIQQYAKSQVRLVELEAEIRAEKNELKRKQFEVERQAIKDSHTRLSIWPLIQAGEFSTIADVGMTADDLDVTSGKLTEWVENQISKMPQALQTAARYGYISRDTALFRGLQKSVQYGDFVAKAILYDHLVENKKKDPKVALAQITEEFVNYDRLPGRVRGSLENMGLLWFYNYKIRSVKVGLSVLRNNPLHAVLAMAMPLPASAGLPIEENLFAVAAQGNLSYSIGPSMALHAINLNPWVNIFN